MLSCSRFAHQGALLVMCLMLLTGLLTAEPNTLSTQEIEDGWILLFDGSSLFGWEAVTDVDWAVSEGAVVATRGPRGLLRTLAEFGDYRLKAEFKAQKGTNSGVFLNTIPQCEKPGPGGGCYELNIAPLDNPFPTGSLVQRKRYEGDRESDTWRSFDVTVQKGEVQVMLDGKAVLSYTDLEPLTRGSIGLQFNEGRIEFRNVKLQPLGLEPIFNGKDLKGWEVYPGKNSIFSVTEAGELSVINGPGQIESQEGYDDFVLQLKVKCNGKHLNSGIFFRSIPGEFWQGYESQIHNGFKEGDRSLPMDYGTGGIYRRQPARLVVANDFTWFSKTIIASGSHMSTWVNGYPVSSWTDTRAPNANPRNGLRTEPGTIIIQGHDPTTDLLFSSIRVAEIR